MLQNKTAQIRAEIWAKATTPADFAESARSPFQAREAPAFPPAPSSGPSHRTGVARETLGCLSRRLRRSEIQLAVYASAQNGAMPPRLERSDFPQDSHSCRSSSHRVSAMYGLDYENFHSANLFVTAITISWK